ncbi:MAG: hypothetical protein HKM24_05400 [Gammaproteobacteria bacterium]|nr:hypothetical protein [Gammaproteobacteria bacterium]
MTSSENFDPARVNTKDETIFGINIRMRLDDPMRTLLGDDWQTTRWYANEHERNQALTEMKRQHEYSRDGDRPNLMYETVESTSPKPLIPKQGN